MQRLLTPIPFRSTKRVVGELIGGARRRIIGLLDRSLTLLRPSRDLSEPDYEWYDHARRGMRDGLEIAGLFLKPIQSKITTWVVGLMPVFKSDNEDAQEALADWMTEHWADVMMGYEESVGLGNSYLLVNADLSLSVISPDVIEPIVSDENYSEVIGWRIREKHEHPTDYGRWMTMTDEYYPDRRVVTVQYETGKPIVTTYRNLLGRVPIVHIPNNCRPNELFGRPETEALVRNRKGLLHRYGEVLDAALTGNIRQGRPVRVFSFEDIASMNKFADTYGETQSRTAVNEDGEEVTEQETILNIDSDQGVLMAGGGTITHSQPGSFAGDTQTLLGILFWLLVQHTEIPENIFGVSMDSSRASAETLMPSFIKWIQKRQGQAGKWLRELAEIVHGMQVLLGDAPAVDRIGIQWQALEDTDKALVQKIIEWAHKNGLLDDTDALSLAPIDIENPGEYVERAKAQREEEGQEQQDEVDFDRALQEAAQAVDQEDEQIAA